MAYDFDHILACCSETFLQFFVNSVYNRFNLIASRCYILFYAKVLELKMLVNFKALIRYNRFSTLDWASIDHNYPSVFDFPEKGLPARGDSGKARHLGNSSFIHADSNLVGSLASL